MKKKITAVLLTAAMLTASGSVFAEIGGTITKSAVLTQSVSEPQYADLSFTVTKNYQEDGVAYLDCTDSAGGAASVVISEKTALFDGTGAKITANDIKDGAQITLFVHAAEPMTMQLPPQYRPNLIVVQTENSNFVKAEVFSNELISADNSLALNIGENTVIETQNGGKATADDIKGMHLAVFYTSSTRSIPAQTTPDKIVILDKSFEGIDAEQAPADMIDGPAAVGDESTILDDAMSVTPEQTVSAAPTLTVNGTVVEADFVTINDTQMLPVRAVAEAMGLEVTWDAQRKAVNVGTLPMGVYFAIGEDSYSKSKMVPFKLGQAPVLIKYDETTSVTYVPVSFFTDVLEAQMVSENGNVSLTR